MRLSEGVIASIVCLGPVSDCWISPRRGERRNAGRALGRHLPVKQEKNTIYIALNRETPGWTKAESSAILTEIFRSYTQSST
jgi:hypothetical protein